jgi:hypothetical protein
MRSRFARVRADGADVLPANCQAEAQSGSVRAQPDKGLKELFLGTGG